MECRAECFLDRFCKVISPCRELMREMMPQYSQIRHGLSGCNRSAKAHRSEQSCRSPSSNQSAWIKCLTIRFRAYLREVLKNAA